MPSALTYPGVYVEEIPSGVRTIAGVATSVGAFVDYFPRGPTNKAVQVFSLADFEREFGGLDPRSEASYAIQQFFLNGGTEAWIVRVVTTGDSTASNNAAAADAQIGASINAGSSALTLTALSEGKWGDSLRARIDQSGTNSSEFNLTLAEVDATGGRAVVVRQEVFRNLSMDSTKGNFVEKIVNDATAGSKLAKVSASGTGLPLPNGTVSGDLGTTPPTFQPSPKFKVTIIDGSTSKTVDDAPLVLPSSITLPNPVPLSTIAAALESALHAADPSNPLFSGASVSVESNRLVLRAGGASAKAIIKIEASTTASTFVTEAKLTGAGSTENLQQYVLGGGTIADTAQRSGTVGNDGTVPGVNAFIADPGHKRGLFALDDVDLFNLLCLPRASMVTGTNALTSSQAQAILSVAVSYCEKRRAFLLIDTPTGVDEPKEIKDWLQTNDSLRHRNAALFYPRVKIPDPKDDFRLRSVGASGTVAGLFARIDAARGVWKAPAGTEATVRNVSELEDVLTDQENGALNPLAINCLRNFPVFGNIVWGARTLEGSDQQASEWKYIPVRRMALFLEESLYRGLKWVVFEPNDEPLWAQIRLNVGAFMQGLFRQGAFQGQTPREAYFVKCDKETTTQADINLGIVNILVGFAPLKPAEFVVLKLQQMAGQIQT